MAKVRIYRTNRRIKPSANVVGEYDYYLYKKTLQVSGQKRSKIVLTYQNIRSIMDYVIRRVKNDKARKNKTK